MGKSQKSDIEKKKPDIIEHIQNYMKLQNIQKHTEFYEIEMVIKVGVAVTSGAWGRGRS